MTTARNILSNTLVQIAGKGMIAVLGLLTSKLLANYLMVAERGVYDYIYSLLALVGIVADMGLYTIAIREISKDESKMDFIIGNILTIRNLLVVGVIVTLFGGLFLSTWLSGEGIDFSFYTGLLIASFGMMIALLNGTVTSVLQVKYDMTHATIAQVLGKILTLGTMVAGIFIWFQKPMPGFDAETSFWGFQILLLAGIVGNILMYYYTRYHVKKYTSLKYRFDFSYWKTLVRDALPYGVALVVATIYFKVDVIIIRMLFDAQNANELIGYYSAPVKIIEIFSVVPLFFLNALLPVLSTYIRDKHEKLSSMLQYSFDFLYMLALPLVIGGVTLAYQIINATNSEAYLSGFAQGVGSDVILQVLIFTSLFSFLNLLFNFVLVASNKQNTLLVINGVSLLFNVVTNIIFIPQYGLLAAAVTTVLTEIMVLVLTAYYARKYVTFHLSFIRSLKVTIVGLLMGLLIWTMKDTISHIFGNDIGVLLITMGSGVFYLGMLWLFGVVNKDMLKLLKKNA